MKRTSYSPAPEYIAKLKQAIRRSYRVNPIHEATWMGSVEKNGEIWSGSVEVFRIVKGNRTERVFAWSRVHGGQLHCFVVGADRGVRTPADAVCAVLSSEREALVG